jgi:cysteinyl-tRNA synthetase
MVLELKSFFYKGKFAVDSERNFMIEKIKPYKKIFVSDYISNNNESNDAYDRIYSLGYLCFVRTKKNYDYKEIPSKIPYENDSDISDINCVQNFLYIINFEKFATKNEVIQAIASTNFDLIIMDLFYDGNEFTALDLKKLKTKANGGKRLVISYVNIGAAEKFRYYWRSEWNSKKPSWITKKYKGYKDEYWVKSWAKEWQDIIYGNNNSYVKKIIDAGFDGVYLDNVEAYYYLFK